jgi:hypothetical protein
MELTAKIPNIELYRFVLSRRKKGENYAGQIPFVYVDGAVDYDGIFPGRR